MTVSGTGGRYPSELCGRIVLYCRQDRDNTDHHGQSEREYQIYPAQH